MSPIYVTKLEQQVRAEDGDLHLVHGHVSRELMKVGNGTLTVMVVRLLKHEMCSDGF